MLDRATLKRLWPSAPDALIDGVIKSAGTKLAAYQINTPLRLAHFFGQISHESDGGTIASESLNYTHAERICEVWPTRFPTAVDAAPYVRNELGLACKVYNGRMGNGIGTEDGFTFRGRGLLQITGRDSYREIGTATGLDLEANPDLAFAPEHALQVAAAEFRKLGCLPACDRDDLRAVTLRVNGGLIGLDSRAFWLARWRPILADGKIADGAVVPAPSKVEPASAPDPWWLVIVKAIIAMFRRSS